MAFTLHITYYILKFVSHLPIDGELLRVSNHKLKIFIAFIQESVNSTNSLGEVIYSVPVIPKRPVLVETASSSSVGALPAQWSADRGVRGIREEQARGNREEGRQEGSQHLRKEAWYPLLFIFLITATATH